MSNGGKGSAPRPLSVSKETFDENFDSIFRKNKPSKEDNTGTDKNEYYDVLSTEEALSRSTATERDRLSLYKK